MNPGKELDAMVATQVLGHPATMHAVRDYSQNIEDAWEVVSAMGMTLIPIEDGSWFAMVGPHGGWRSPAEFIECMQKGDFARSGAAVTQSAPLSICLAALNAVQNRRNQNNFDTLLPDSLN
jgi:hypothetical protein